MVVAILKDLLLVLVVATAAIVFFWVVVLRIVSRFVSHPCPAAASFIVYNPIRRHYMRPVLDRVGIRPGERVLELGPGPGLFTIDAAERLGLSGKLIAVDIQPEMIAKVQELMKENQVTNVETRVASGYELPLPDNSIDRAFLVTVLPEIADKEKALRELFRILRPGGIFSDTEEFLDPDYPRAKSVISHAEKVGFELVERFGSFWLYTLNFRKPG